MKIKSKLICNILIFISILMILLCSYLIYSEISGAKEYCNELGWEYNLKFPDKHLCNNKTLVKYDYGWGFENIYP